MERIKRHFENAMVCQPDTRMAGIETESLFVNAADGQTISLEKSQKIMKKLVEFGYSIEEEKNSLITKVKKEGIFVSYDLGWNNFEIITPPILVSKINVLFTIHDKALKELRLAGKHSGARMLELSHDNSLSDTLIIPDKRDEIWLELDGPALYGVGHISCIHYNIDLTSIEEGMEWIKKMMAFYQQDRQVPWPAKANKHIWEEYISNSFAQYEKDRYGPSPADFESYCNKLAGYKVVMNKVNDNLSIADPVLSFAKTKEADIDLFLRSVWWWARLRVRGGNLVLEIRDIPRSLEASKSFWIIQSVLSLDLEGVSGC